MSTENQTGNEAGSPALPCSASSCLQSHSVRFGHFEGGPRNGTGFLRNYDSSEMYADGHHYRANRDRVEDRGDGTLALIFEYVGPDSRQNDRTLAAANGQPEPT